jgi:hypothetical protein
VRLVNAPIVARNLLMVVWNRAAKLTRVSQKHARRGLKQVNESVKEARAQVKHGREGVRDAVQHTYAGTVRGTRTWERMRRRTWDAFVTESSVRRELRAAARGDGPIVVGPWLGEVGYEALYWVPFVRWFVEHYQVDSDRLVVVSRGGVSSWYADITSHYVELLDLFTPREFAERNAARQAQGDQKQLARSGFDAEILARVREQLRVPGLTTCHPSTMFRLMRNFWLGNDSLQQVLEHTRYVPLRRARSPVSLAGLPDRFVAVKFYTGRALPDTPEHRAALRRLIEACDLPVVVLNTSLALDEHEDFVFSGMPNVTMLDAWMTPQNNLGVQSEVIRRATRFIGTCGSLAWLAPMLGTETLALYADDYFLLPHLYAAGQIYRSMDAAPFVPADLRALDAVTAPVARPAGRL